MERLEYQGAIVLLRHARHQFNSKSKGDAELKRQKIVEDQEGKISQEIMSKDNVPRFVQYKACTIINEILNVMVWTMNDVIYPM